MNRARAWFRRSFFDKELSFEYRLNSIFFIGAIILSMLSFSVNALLGASLSGIVIQAMVNVVCFVVFFMPLGPKQKVLPGLLLLLIFGYIPFMYFQYAGYDGSVLFFVPLSVMILAFTYRGRMRIFLVVLDVAVYVALILLQASFPWLVTPMASPEARVPDLLTAIVFTLLGMFILSRYVMRAYESERLRNVYLLNELESKNQELEELSIRDSLTGVYNRRYLTEASNQILVRSRREGKRICVIMLDIDFFKRINDSFGHSAGDDILVKVVEATQSQLRQEDILARYGGEEFIAVLYPETIDNAEKVAERIREAVSAIESPDGSKVTVSLGVVQSRDDDQVDSIFDRADEYLYLAKESGRNRVCVGDRNSDRDEKGTNVSRETFA